MFLNRLPDRFPGRGALESVLRKRLHFFLAAYFIFRFLPVADSGLTGNWRIRGPVFAIATLGMYATGAGAIVYLWDRREDFHIRLPSRRQMWIWGVGLGIVNLCLGNLMRGAVLGNRPEWSLFWHYPVTLALHATTQFIFAAAQEEPMFRGFLWGWLRQRHWADGVILVAQAGLFFLAHAYYARPGMYVHWANTFLMGLLMGLAAWRTRSILPSMVVHAIGNCGSMFFPPN